MWRLILRLKAKNQLLGSLSVKHRVSFSGYPLSYWKDKDSLYLIVAGIMIGEEKDKTSLFKEIKNHKAILNIERNKDFVILTSKQPLFAEPAYTPKIIRPSPVFIAKEGYHLWDLASFDRSALEKVWLFAKKHHEAKLLSLKDEKITNIAFTRLLSELTDKQKKAMQIAIDNGYYDFPKNIKMESLAKIMKISYSTYQAHLKKAESKTIPAAYRNSI